MSPRTAHFETSPKKTRGLGSATLDLRDAILDSLERVDKPVTVRQAYYLVASAGGVEKDDSGYGRVQRQILAMRREGLIPYGHIADNTRWKIGLDTHNNIDSFLEEASQLYRRDLWVDAPVRLEIWCEKDSIAGVLQRVTSEYRVDLLPARGYSSETFAHEAAESAKNDDRDTFIYYIGDLDPSGWDASRDLERRLKGFCPEITFQRIALMPEDIDRHQLQTRPTKVSDSRHKQFFKALGEGHPSVELEAMHPDTLRGILRGAIEQHLDRDHLARVLTAERAERESLANVRSALWAV